MSTGSTSLTLKPHQVEGIEWLGKHPYAFLADSPRAGKTAQLLVASEGKTLVVAPHDLEDTWRREHELWTPDLDMTFVSYNSVAMRVPNAAGQMRKTVPAPKPEYKNFDTVICDEAHGLVNPKANWTGAVSKLNGARLYLATGTPIPNWAYELLMILRLLYPGDRRFTNKRNWEERWFDWWEPPWGGRQIIAPKKDALGPKPGIAWEEFWFENGLDGPDGRMLQREVDLGVPYTEQTIEVDMTASQKAVYKKLAKEYVALTDTDEEISAWSDGGLHTKLMQCSTGLEVLTDAKGSGKFDVVARLLEDAPRSPTLAFCYYRSTSRRVFEIAQKQGLRAGLINGDVAQPERDRIEQQFRSGQLDVVVGTMRTIAVGHEFANASTEIFVEHDWTPWRNDQAIKRAMKFGKTTHVHVIHLYTKDSVDIGTRTLVGEKSDQQIKALTARQFRSIIYG